MLLNKTSCCRPYKSYIWTCCYKMPILTLMSRYFVKILFMDYSFTFISNQKTVSTAAALPGACLSHLVARGSRPRTWALFRVRCMCSVVSGL